MSICRPNDTLIHRDELGDPGAVSVVRGEGSERVDVLIVRSGEIISAYKNVCPHKGTPLETFEGHFFTRDQSRLLCSTHGAEFRFVDGYCVAGPCKGRALQPVSVYVDQAGFVKLK